MSDIPEPLRDCAAQLQAARQSGDGAAIAALYSEDAMLILPDGQRLAGRAAIAAHYRGVASATAARGKAAAGREPAFKFYFFPPLVHAIASVNGRHGEKHSLVDIYQQQADLRYLLVFSSWTLR